MKNSKSLIIKHYSGAGRILASQALRDNEPEGSHPSYHNKSPLAASFDFVELEGFEPSSKRGTNKLSTCLASTWL